MAKLSSTLSLNDQMTQVLNKLADVLDTCVGSFEKLKEATRDPIDNSSFKQAESSISDMGDAVDEATAKMNQAGDTMEDVAGNEDNLTDETGKLEKALNGAGNGAEKAESKLQKVGKALKIVGQATAIATGAVVVGTVAAGKKLWNMANETAQAGDNIDKMSQKIGISAKSYQEWGYVFDKSGADVNSLQTGMKTLSSVITDAASGSSSAAEKLNAVGLSVKDLAGKSQDEQLSMVVSALQDMDSGAERTSAATDLLGRSATDLAAVLNMTADETNALKQEANDYGMVMSDEAVSASAIFQDSLTKLSGTVSGLKNMFVSGLLPGLTQVIDGFSDLVAGNKGAADMIENGLASALDYLTGMLPKAVDLLSSVVSAVLQSAPAIVESLAGSLLNAVDQLAPVAGDLIINLASSILTMLPKIASTGVSLVGTLVSSISQQLPTLIPLAVEAVVSIVDGLVSGGSLQMILDAALQLIMGLGQGLLDALPNLISRLPEIIVGICDFLIGAIPQIISAGMDLLGSLLDNIGGIIAALIPAIQAIIYGLINALISHAGEFIGAGLKLLVSLIGALPTAIAQICAAIPQIVVSMIQNFLSFVSGFADAGKQLLMGLWNGISDTVGWVIDRIKGIGSRILGGLKSIFKEHSPSKATEEMGINLDRGLANGITYSAGEAVSAAQNMANRVLNATDGIGGHMGFDAAVKGVTTSVIETKAYVAEEAKLDEKDMELMQEIAEREAINKFTTKKINVDFSGMNNNFTSDIDAQDWLRDLRETLEYAYDSGSEGGE